MARTVEATIDYVQVGRRRRVHRRTTTEGITQIGTERCNIDDSAFPPFAISDAEYETAVMEGRMCGWCAGQPADELVNA
jgi:hypothetical protein